MKFEVRIYGLPVAQGRPRAFKLPTGQVRVYDPPNSRDWKRTVMAQTLAVRPMRLLVGPLAAEMDFYLPRPKSAPKRRVYPTTKPDCTNLVKGTEDALKGIVLSDDSLIVKWRIAKLYADGLNAPGVHVVIEELA